MAGLQFDASQHEPTQSFEPLPPGWYQAAIVDSDLRPTKNGKGERLNMMFQILAPKMHANRKVFIGLNIRHQNQVAQEIAQRDLSAICHATEKLQIQDSQQLHGIPMHVKLKIDPGSDGFEPRNDITAYKKLSETVNLAGAEATKPAWGNGQPAADASKWSKTDLEKSQPEPKKEVKPLRSEPVPDVADKPPWE